MIFIACASPLHAASWIKPAASSHAVPPALQNALEGDGWVETQQVTEADPQFDPMFGYAVAVHGRTAMIGAQQARIGGNDSQGAVYVYEQADDGTWSRTQKLVADDGQAADTFGHSIVFEGDTALIGAYAALVGENFSQGAVYVFTLSNGSWTQTQKLVASDGQMFENFGYSLGLHGTTALIGADAATVGDNGFQGAVYEFTFADGTWTQGQKLSASDGGIGDIFGYSIAFDGTTAMIGAYANNGYQGAVYAFDHSGGTWAETQKLVADDGTPNAYFGYATALSGSTFLVGAWGASPGGNDMQGEAYVFTQSNGTWTQTQTLLADDGASDTQPKFGHAVAMDGTHALIGADGVDSATGAVYAFDLVGDSWTQTQKFYASDAAPADQFANPVTIDGTTALVGSFLWITPDHSAMPGAAYFFELGGTPPPTYTIGGHVEGLAGSGLVLQQNGGDNLAISADGDFTFATPLNDGATYAVTVFAQPGDPAQTCTVANGSGTVAGANVDTVDVTCTTEIVDEIFASGFDTGGGGGAATLSETIDMTPVSQNSVACGNSDDGTTADNQYWRRYDFADYSVTSAASIDSVDVSVQATTGAPTLTVTLYTMPHAVTVDTIDIDQLTKIGVATATAPADAALTSINVPISGTVADTVGTDLVVEVSTDDFSGTGMAFYIGSTASTETHPSFLTSAACGVADPTPTADIGYPDMHIIQAVNITY
jgi:FG-GAP repeat protein